MGDVKQFYRAVLTNDVMKKCVQMNRGSMLSVMTTHKHKEAEFQVMVQFWCLNDGFIHLQIAEADNNEKNCSPAPDLLEENSSLLFTSESVDLTNVVSYTTKPEQDFASNTGHESNETCEVTHEADVKRKRKSRKFKPVDNKQIPEPVAILISELEQNTLDFSPVVKHEPESKSDILPENQQPIGETKVLQRNLKLTEISEKENSSAENCEAFMMLETFNAPNDDDFDNDAIDSDVTDIYSDTDLQNANIKDNVDTAQNECDNHMKKVKKPRRKTEKSEIKLKISLPKKRGYTKKGLDGLEKKSRKLKKLKLDEKSKQKIKKPRKIFKKEGLEQDPSKIVKCQYCDFYTIAKQYLGRHMRCKHPEIKEYSMKDYGMSEEPAKCKFCQRQMLHDHSLYRHVMVQHKMEPGYNEEIERLEKSRRCKCPYCPTTVTRPAHLQRHINDVHECDKTKGVRCELCGLLLKNNACYQNHITYTHNTEKKSLCTICGNMYKSVGHLNEHLRNVHGTEKFHCDLEGCDFVANSEKYLKKHKKYKHGLATFMCDICARKFKCMQRLRLHYQLIHKVGPLEQHTCSECGKKFNLKSNMKKHIDGVHKKTWRFKCMFCEKGFFSSKLLEIHVGKHHNLPTDAEPKQVNEKTDVPPTEKQILDFSISTVARAAVDAVSPGNSLESTATGTLTGLQNVQVVVQPYNLPASDQYDSKTFQQLTVQQQHEAENLTWNSELIRGYAYNGADYSAEAVQSAIVTQQQQQQEEMDCSVKDQLGATWQVSSGESERVLTHMKL